MPKIVTPEQLEDFLQDRSKVDAMIKDGTFGPAIGDYIKNMAARDLDLKAQVSEQVQLGIAEFMQKNGVDPKRVDLSDFKPGAGVKYSPIANRRAVGAPLNGVFEDLGEFMQAVWHQERPKGELANKVETLLNYQEKIPSEGGFLVPEEFRAELLRLSHENSVVRPRARVVPMASATLRYPAIDETSHASSVFGGIVVYRTEEGAELTESTAAFGSIKLEASKQTALAHVTNELVRDAAGGFAMYIEQMFPEAIAWFEDVDFLVGNGAGAPLGVLNAGNSGRVLYNRATNNLIDWPDVVGMYARMLPQSLNRAVWLCSPEALPELFQMTVNVQNVAGTENVGGSAVYITEANGAPTMMLLGRPLIVTEKASQLGSAGDLNFVDFGYYLIGDRQMMTVDSSPHVKFTSDKTTYRVIQRNDGRPWLQSPLTPYNGGDTLSPYVILDA